MSDDKETKQNRGEWELANRVYDHHEEDLNVILGAAFGLIAGTVKAIQGMPSKIEGLYSRARKRLPGDDYQDPEAWIAGPIFDGIKYLKPGNAVWGLYEELLMKACDKTRVDEVRPSFVRMLKDFSPYEARIITALSAGWRIGKLGMEYTFLDATSGPAWRRSDVVSGADFPAGFVENSENYLLSLHLLESMGLIFYRITKRTVKKDTTHAGSTMPQEGVTIIAAELQAECAMLTLTGQALCKACVSDEAIAAIKALASGDVPTLENLYGLEEPYG